MRNTHRQAPATPTLPFRLLLGAALIVISYLAITPLTYPVVGEFNDKFNHLAAFYALALLADFSFPQRPFSAAKIVPLMGYGALIEIVQHFLPFRYLSLFDLMADAAGLGAYLLSLPLVRQLPGLKLRWQGQR